MLLCADSVVLREERIEEHNVATNVLELQMEPSYNRGLRASLRQRARGSETPGRE